jgi:phage terminase large subunit-like protein
MADLQPAYEALAALDPSDALLALDAIEERRKEKHFAKYWSSNSDPNYRVFFDSIEADFQKFTAGTKIFAFLGGNRSSKTERGAFLAVAWLMGKEYFRDEPSWRYVKDLPIPDHGCNIWAVGLDFSVIRDVIWNEKLRRGHQHPGLLPGTPSPLVIRVSDSEFQIQVEVNGRKSSLTCKSAEAGREKMQSASVDLVWIDEECDEDVYLELFQRTLDCAGKIVITLTPLNDIASGVRSPWVYDLYKVFKKGLRADLCFVSLNSLDNPFIPDSEKLLMKQQWAGHAEEGARLRGEFIRRAGLVFSQWDREKHILKKMVLPQEWRRIITIDPAATGVTACAWLAVSPRNDVYLYRLYYEKDQIVSDHAKNIITLTAGERIDTYLIDPWWGAARNAETHKQGYMLYREAGLPVRLAPRAAEYGRDVMQEYLSATLEPTARHPKFYVVGEIPQFVSEIESYSWDFFGKGPLKGTSKDKPRKKDDHAINAVEFALSMNPKGNRLGSVSGTHNPSNSYT